MSNHKSGFISIVGRPNVGKSTLLNAFVGSKIAIVADKPQTTRTSIKGVVTLPEAQLIFIDTPGIHKTDSLIDKRMMESVRGALGERDIILFVIDSEHRPAAEDRHAIDMVRKLESPVLLVINKIDLVKDKRALLPLIDLYRKEFDFTDYFPISATKSQGLNELRQGIIDRLPEGPAVFPDDYLTDQPERFLAAELVREKVLHVTRQEVPHSVAVSIEKWEQTKRITNIYATIHVERTGQKAIVIGKGASVLKQIGTEARVEMEAIFGCKIYLDLHVKVQPGWRQKSSFLDELDWRKMGTSDES